MVAGIAAGGDNQATLRWEVRNDFREPSSVENKETTPALAGRVVSVKENMYSKL
jgi:hypothetical protein